MICPFFYAILRRNRLFLLDFYHKRQNLQKKNNL